MFRKGSSMHRCVFGLLAGLLLLGGLERPCWGQIVSLLTATQGKSDDEPQRHRGWTIVQDGFGEPTHTMRLRLHPSNEPMPALRYQFFGDSFERLSGNAALYYLKAMGFLEQSRAQSKLADYHQRAVQKANEEGFPLSETAPYSWPSMPTSELPLEQVKEYLSYTQFQRMFLREATQQDSFSLDRHIETAESPVGYLLPEIQAMRQLARNHSLRIRVAMREDDVDDAITMLGEQYALANHLGQDEFLVSTLVAMAVADIGFEDGFELAQHAECPNLFWAYARLPKPLVAPWRALDLERRFLYLQLKPMGRVDETPKSPGYWSDFIDELIPSLRGLSVDGLRMPSTRTPNAENAHELDRAAVVGFIAASYPKARLYLIREWDMDPEVVDAYPTAQTVFLAAKKFYDATTQNYQKWYEVPYWQALQHEEFTALDEQLKKQLQDLGWASAPTNLFLSASGAIRSVQARTQSKLAALQTIEAIRMYAAKHDGQLPPTLDRLPVPAPLDSMTGKPIAYEVSGKQAVLRFRTVGIRYRLIVEIEQ